jgi:hypothetical protein
VISVYCIKDLCVMIDLFAPIYTLKSLGFGLKKIPRKKSEFAEIWMDFITLRWPSAEVVSFPVVSAYA